MHSGKSLGGVARLSIGGGIAGAEKDCKDAVV